MALHRALSAAPPYISAEKVRQLISMGDLIEEVGRALQWFSDGEAEGGVVQPVRQAIPVDEHDGYLLVMPAYSRRLNTLVVKLVTRYRRNVEKGIPTPQGIVNIFDPETGSLQALVDSGGFSDMRTAAASACAIRALVTTPPLVLCIVGTGILARSHAEALKVHHSFSEIRVWGRNPTNARKCAADIGGEGVVVYESLPEAVKDADVIVTVTMATEPVLHGRWLKPGAVVCCVGACRPNWRELDDEVMDNSVVVVDSREAAMKESGDVILSKVEIFAEIGEVISGKKRLPKVPECGKKFITFKSLGMAVEDCATAKLVYDKYQQQKNTEK